MHPESETLRNVLLGLPLVIFILFCLALASQEYWVFSISALLGWSIADFGLLFFSIEPDEYPKGFVIYSISIIAASAFAAVVVELALKHIPNEVNSYPQIAYGSPTVFDHSLSWLAAVVGLSSIATAIAYFVASVRDRSRRFQLK